MSENDIDILVMPNPVGYLPPTDEAIEEELFLSGLTTAPIDVIPPTLTTGLIETITVSPKPPHMPWAPKKERVPISYVRHISMESDPRDYMRMGKDKREVAGWSLFAAVAVAGGAFALWASNLAGLLPF